MELLAFTIEIFNYESSAIWVNLYSYITLYSSDSKDLTDVNPKKLNNNKLSGSVIFIKIIASENHFLATI